MKNRKKVQIKILETNPKVFREFCRLLKVSVLSFEKKPTGTYFEIEADGKTLYYLGKAKARSEATDAKTNHIYNQLNLFS